MLILFTLLINGLLIAVLTTDDDEIEVKYSFGEETLYILGFCHLALSVLKLISYTIVWGRLASKNALANRKSYAIKLPPLFSAFYKCLSYLLTCKCCRRNQYTPEQKYENYIQIKNKIKLPIWLWRIYYYFTNPESIYYLAFLALSILGSVYNHAYFAYHMIILIKGVRLIKYVLESVTRNVT